MGNSVIEDIFNVTKGHSRTKTSLNPPKTRLFGTFLFVVIDIRSVCLLPPHKKLLENQLRFPRFRSQNLWRANF